MLTKHFLILNEPIHNTLTEKNTSKSQIPQSNTPTKTIIPPSNIEYLGVILDKNLTFPDEIKSILQKMAFGIKTINSINKTGSSQVGAISKAQNIRRTTIGNIWKKYFFPKKV